MKSTFVILAMSFTLILAIGCNKKNKSKQIRTPSGLIYEVTKEGTGTKQIKRGDWIKMHQESTYSDGTTIFSTTNLGYPVTIQLGGGMSVRGVEEGIRGMRVGEIRKLIVPPALSKRRKYAPHISPDSTLYYTIEILEINPPSFN